jgi:hypothetical protein
MSLLTPFSNFFRLQKNYIVIIFWSIVIHFVCIFKGTFRRLYLTNGFIFVILRTLFPCSYSNVFKFKLLPFNSHRAMSYGDLMPRILIVGLYNSIPRVSECLSLRSNWLSRPLSRQRVCPHPIGTKGRGGATLPCC